MVWRQQQNRNSELAEHYLDFKSPPGDQDNYLLLVVVSSLSPTQISPFDQQGALVMTSTRVKRITVDSRIQNQEHQDRRALGRRTQPSQAAGFQSRGTYAAGF